MDALHTTGSSIKEEEIIGYVVDGLDETCRSFLTHLHFNPTTSFNELVSHLLQEEDLSRRTRPPDKPNSFHSPTEQTNDGK